MAMHERIMSLVRLSDTNLELANAVEDIRGLNVRDISGDDLGQVDELFIDERERKVRFLQVASGGFLGLGATKFLLPVEAITRITADLVYVNQSRVHVAEAPRYDPTLVDESYVRDVYRYYGYPPYWGPDYAYPPEPVGTAEPMGRATPAETRVSSATRPSAQGSTEASQPRQLKEVMTRQVEVVHPDATLWEAAQKMASLDVGPLPVCSGDELVGMLTDRDITVRATAAGRDPKATRVYEIMTPDVLFIYDDEDVRDAARLMSQHQIRRLAVLNRANKLVGMVSLGDLAVHVEDDRLVGETLEGVSEPANSRA